MFEGKSWLVYENLRQRDKQLHKNLCSILKEMLRGDPTIGLGRPEALHHNLAGFWSRRLSQKDKLIYKFDETHIYVFAIGGHNDSLSLNV